MKKFNVRRIIQLPDKIFNKTEARTHIIFISKSKSENETCELLISTNEGNLSKSIVVPKKKLGVRMDYQFHKALMNSYSNYKTLKEVGGIIKRGKFSFKELRESKLSYFHSTHFKENSVSIKFQNQIAQEHISYAANAGDILMCRVGKRIVGRVAIIKSGRIINSDCVYRIIVPKKFQSVVLNSFLSSSGKTWLSAYAHGVCSQVISKSDLENFPLFSSGKLYQTKRKK